MPKYEEAGVIVTAVEEQARGQLADKVAAWGSSSQPQALTRLRLSPA